MTPYELFANPAFLFLIDLFVKALALILLAAGLTAALRKSSAAVRHRVWSLTLAGLLLLPVFSYLLPELQLPILPADMLKAPAVEETVAEESDGEIPAMELSSTQAEEVVADGTQEPLPQFGAEMPPGMNPWELGPAGAAPLGMPPLVADGGADDPPLVAEKPGVESEAVEPGETAVAATPPVGQPSDGSVWLWVWFTGVAVFLLPVVIGLLQNRFLSVLALDVDDEVAVALLDSLRATLSVDRRVRLLESEYGRIPLTWGLLRPVILFPAGWREWTGERTRMVLLHELAHIKRCDVAYQLAARIACAVYWFHPLCWYAMRRMKIESELACDDCVLMTGESPQRYAAELISIARSARRLMFPAAVAMAHPSSLERRVRALLDRARSRLPLGGRLAGILFLASLPIVAAIAAVTPVETRPEADVVLEADEDVALAAAGETSEETPDELGDNDKAKEADDGVQILRGTVVGPDGKPVAGARVRYLYSFTEHSREKDWLRNTWITSASSSKSQIGVYAETTTDDEGCYELAHDWKKFQREDELRATSRTYHSTMIVASVNNDRRDRRLTSSPMIGWIRDVTIFKDPGSTIRLSRPASGTIRGRLVDLEGRSVPGARITIEAVASADPGDIDRWLAEVERQTAEGLLPPGPKEDYIFAGAGNSPRKTATRFPTSQAAVTGEMIGLRPIVTDEQGRFEIATPGDDNLLVIRAEADGMATINTNLVTRDLPRTIEARAPRNIYLGMVGVGGEYHGRDATIVLSPSQTITGVIRDADTHEPIPGVTVATQQAESVDETDEEGRYRLGGLTPGAVRSISIYPPQTSPYFVRWGVQVPEQGGTAPIKLDLDLPAGIWIEGRVINRETGKGQPNVTLHYSPYLDNRHAERYPSFNPQVIRIITNDRRFATDENGGFRVLGMRGRGIVMAVCRDGVFCTGTGAEVIEGLTEANGFKGRITYDEVSPTLAHAFAAVDIPDEATRASLDLDVDPGKTVTLVVLDAEGKPIESVEVEGRFPLTTGQVDRSMESPIRIRGVAPGERRPVRILDKDHRTGLTLELGPDVEPNSTKTVQLKPLATIIGRLVDGDGAPVEDSAVRVELHNSYRNFAIGLGSVFTDSDGRFRFTELLPGGTYHVSSQSQVFQYQGLIKSITPEPGETIDLGEIDLSKEERPEPKRTAANAAPKTNDEAAKAPFKVRGRVVDPDGKAVGGARVLVASAAVLREVVADLKTDGEGRFEVSIEDAYTREQLLKGAEIAASADGYGAAWFQGEMKPGEDVTLRLAVDEPVRGRILDLQGRPIAGVRITVNAVGVTENDDAGPLIQSLTERQEGTPRRAATQPQTTRTGTIVSPELYPAVVSDGEGRFVLRGLGRERYAEVVVESPAIVSELVYVITRPQVSTIHVPRVEQRPEYGKQAWYGSEFTLVAEPCRPVVGTVRAEDSQKPLAGVRVAAVGRLAFPNRYVETTTDEKGEFRLTGLAQAERQRIMAIPADGGLYPATSIGVPKGQGLEDVTVDLKLPRGVRIEGTVRDKISGKPVAASVTYFVFAGDPEFARVWQTDRYPVDGYCSTQTDSDGKFSLIGFPGRGVIVVRTRDQSYLKGVGADDIDGLNRVRHFETLPFVCEADNYNALAEVVPNESLDPVKVELVVDPGETIEGRLVDQDGKDLPGALVRGLTPADYWDDEPLPSATFNVTGLKPGERRHLLFLQEQAHLAGRITVRAGDGYQTFTLKIAPWGTISGQVVDEDGAPVAGAEFESIRSGENEYVYSLPRKRMVTDREGRFRVSGLIPGAKYSFGILEHVDGNNYLRRVAEDVVVDPGEMKDLGTLKIEGHSGTDLTAVPPTSDGQSDHGESEKQSAHPICTGRVIDENGRAVNGADVAVIAMRVRPSRGGDLSPSGEVLAKGTTAADGQFRMTLNETVTETTYRYAKVIARFSGAAVAWDDFHPGAVRTDVSLRLQPQELVRGRLIDIEGKPANGVTMFVRGIIKPTEGRPAPEGVGYPGGRDVPRAWISPIKTDERGRFVIVGVPKGFGVYLHVEGSERFAPQEIALNTGMPEQRGERDGTYRPLVKNLKPGEEAVLALTPAQLIEGVVRYKDTGEPAPHARLTIWAGQQENGGSMSSVAGEADEKGHYRITPNPGVRFGVIAYPPDGVPYLAYQTPFDQSIRWKAGEQKKEVDIDLPRGVLVNGRVVEEGAGTPIVGASIQYVPESNNNKNTSREILTGWQGIQLSGEDGRFEIVVLPGSGRLLAHAANSNYVLQEIGSRQLTSNLPGGQRAYAHAIEKIDPAEGSEPVEVALAFVRGASVSGLLVDEKGKRIDEAVLVTRLAIHPTTIYWRGSDLFRAADGRFELKGLEKGKDYRVSFLDAENRLGATAVLNSDNPDPTIVLKPCGRAKMRFVDADGKPVADYYPTIEIVVTPGSHRFDGAAARRGELASDSDFISNIDRTNYPSLQKSDEHGELLLPALIPGATYQVVLRRERYEIERTFMVEAGETVDLGDIKTVDEKGADSKPTSAKPEAVKKKDKTTAAASVTVRGRVLDPDGEPLSGATIRAAMPNYSVMQSFWPALRKVAVPEATSGADGRFEISFNPQPLGDLSQYDPRWRKLAKIIITAAHPDFGPAWAKYDEIGDGKEATLKLVPDVPIRGRIVDLEGRPIPDVEVTLMHFRAGVKDNLDPWLEAVKQGGLPWTISKYAPDMFEPGLVGVSESFRTDSQGRFEIRGIGRGRVVWCWYHGETAAFGSFKVVTRAMEPIQQMTHTPPDETFETIYGSEFSVVAAPSRPIVGVVKDAKTGEPLAGVDVKSEMLAGYPVGNYEVLHTTTDEDGKYRMTGFPIGTGNRLLALPNDVQPYFVREVDVANPAGTGAIETPIELHRGLWITGRVTDKENGRPMSARVYYLPFRDNKYARALPEFRDDGYIDGTRSRYQSRDDGTYKIVGLPGRAIVAVESVLKQYRHGVGADRIEGLQEDSDFHGMTEHGVFETYANPLRPGRNWPNNLAEVDPSPNAKNVTVNFELEFGAVVPVTVLDPDGQPTKAKKLRVRGSLNPGSRSEVDSPRFDVGNLTRKENRSVVVQDDERQLGRVAHISFKPVRTERITIRLKPLATIRGQLVDGDGVAMRGVTLHAAAHSDLATNIDTGTTISGKDGSFAIRIPAGADYEIVAEGAGVDNLRRLVNDVEVKPGETSNLGDIDVTKFNRPQAKSTAAVTGPDASKSGPGMAKPDRGSLCTGQVIDASGRPVAGAHVAVIGRSKGGRRGGDVYAGGEILAEGETGADGRFELTLSGVSGETHNVPMVIARKDGSAMGWSDWGEIDLDGARNETTLTLRPEEPIRGRLIDIEGRPLDGTRLLVWMLTKPTADPSFPTNVAVFTVDMDHEVPAAWIPTMTTDKAGHFTVRGIPAGFGAVINVEGGERASPQRIALNTGKPEQHDEKYDAYHWLVKNVKPGEEAVLALGPAQRFEGVVRFADTGEPAAGARMTFWAASQRRATSTVWVPTRADNEGRYRVTPNPGVAFGYIVYSPEGTPYLGRQTRPEEPILRRDSAPTMQVDIDLPRGVLVRGRVVEAGSGKPVAGAAIEYVPESDNNKNATKDIVTGSGSTRLSDADGRFDIAVLPGPGRLLVRAHGGTYVLQTIGSRELKTGLPGGRRQYAHAVRKIDPAADSEPLDVTVELHPGKSVAGRLVDEGGEPIDEAVVVTRLVVPPSSGDWVWRGIDPPIAHGGRFELRGLAEGQNYAVHFLDRSNRLGATATINAKNPSPTVVLKPCGSASARFVDQNGDPIRNFGPLPLNMVVTPGVPRFDYEAVKRGEAAADEEPVSNIDRVNYDSRPKSDENGQISYPALIPGAHYRFINYVDGKPPVASDFIAKSGQDFDMGEIVIQTDEASEATPTAATTGDRTEKPSETDADGDAAEATSVRGTITDPEGKPVAGAIVAVVGFKTAGGDARWEALGEAVTDSSGGYEVSIQDASFKTHSRTKLIARTERSGIAWRDVNLGGGEESADLTLQPEQLIQAKLVDIEGRPAAGLAIKSMSVVSAREDGEFGLALGFPKIDPMPKAWLSTPKTDQRGILTLRNVAAGYGVFLTIPGTEEFAPQDLALNTGIPEERGERDRTYRPQVRNMKPGEIATIVLAPAQFFGGVVLLGDGDEPAANARISIWSSQQEAGSMSSVEGKTDAKGRFRLNPNPGVRFGLTVYPPEGTPYQVKRLNDLRWKAGPESKNIEIRLDRGVLAEGIVVDAETGDPVKNAAVQYYPDRAHNKNLTDDVVTGWQSIQRTDGEGRFELPVLAGPGTLLVHAADRKYILQEVGSRELDAGKEGGVRMYAHAFEKIDPAAGEPFDDVKIELQPGASVEGTLVDTKGKPIERALIISRLRITEYSPDWRGGSLEALHGKFEIEGLREEAEYPVYFLDPKNRLGATAMISTKNPSPRIVLEPCGSATGRFVNQDGKPIANFSGLGIDMVVTSGKPKYDFDARRKGELVADEDFVANVDQDNYRPGPTTDDDGNITFPVLIPGAQYRFVNFIEGKVQVSTEFIAKSGETYEMGEIKIDIDDEE